MQGRNETRRQRYDSKVAMATKLPVEVCTINFQCEENVAFVLRSAACFGASTVNVIGSLPSHRELMARSGTLQDYIAINQFSNPHDFLVYCRENCVKIISAELDAEAVSIHEYNFQKEMEGYNRICIITGHETLGIPVEISANASKVYIPMPGVGYCLNTSVAASIFLYEAAKHLNHLGRS